MPNGPDHADKKPTWTAGRGWDAKLLHTQLSKPTSALGDLLVLPQRRAVSAFASARQQSFLLWPQEAACQENVKKSDGQAIVSFVRTVSLNGTDL